MFTLDAALHSELTQIINDWSVLEVTDASSGFKRSVVVHLAALRGMIATTTEITELDSTTPLSELREGRPTFGTPDDGELGGVGSLFGENDEGGLQDD